MHKDALASLTASMAQFVGVTEKVLVITHDLYYPRPLTEKEQTSTEVIQDEESLATSRGPEQREW